MPDMLVRLYDLPDAAPYDARTAASGIVVRRLEAWIAGSALGSEAIVWVYGDSAGDRELLARADHPVRVGRDRLTHAPSSTP